jgi:hypothetical protein
MIGGHPGASRENAVHPEESRRGTRDGVAAAVPVPHRRYCAKSSVITSSPLPAVVTPMPT